MLKPPGFLTLEEALLALSASEPPPLPPGTDRRPPPSEDLPRP